MTHARVSFLVSELGRELARLEDDEGVTRDLRWRLHALACSHLDFTIWVEQREGDKWTATEIETGCSGPPATSPHQAVENYFAQQQLYT